MAAKKRTAPKKVAKEKPQKQRFVEAARALGVDETGAQFERALKKIAPPRRRRP